MCNVSAAPLKVYDISSTLRYHKLSLHILRGHYDISCTLRYHNVLLEWYHSIIDKQTVYRNNCYDDNCIKTNDKVYFTMLILVQISTFIHFNDVSLALILNAPDVKICIYRFEFISRHYIFMLISHTLSITQLW